MSGSFEMNPGSSSTRSVKLDGCRWAIAWRSMTEAAVTPRLSRAVTTTSPSSFPFISAISFSRRSRSASSIESIRAMESSESAVVLGVDTTSFPSLVVENIAGMAASSNAEMTGYLTELTRYGG